jgi:hypothetical protein
MRIQGAAPSLFGMQRRGLALPQVVVGIDLRVVPPMRHYNMRRTPSGDSRDSSQLAIGNVLPPGSGGERDSVASRKRTIHFAIKHNAL